MKKIKILCSLLFLLVAATNCTKIEGIDQDLSFMNNVSSTNLSKVFTISNDNSGNVTISPLGEGVAYFKVEFGHGTGSSSSATVYPGYNVTHSYPEGSYTVTITAYDLAGVSTVNTYPLTVTYRAPEDITITVDANVVVSVKALYAKSFLVYFGDVTNEVGTPLAIGAKLPAHAYPPGGPYDLTVIALSGGAATTTVVRTMFGLPITFESPTTNYSFVTTGTAQSFDKIANPLATGLNTSAKVGMFTRGDPTAVNGTTSKLDIPIDFAQGKIIKMLVYNPEPTLVNKKMYIELGSAVAGTPKDGVAAKSVKITKSGEWEEMVFDFSTFTAAEIPANTKFNQMIIRYAIGIPAGKSIYIDSVSLTN
jgi:hypothetical protein